MAIGVLWHNHGHVRSIAKARHEDALEAMPVVVETLVDVSDGGGGLSCRVGAVIVVGTCRSRARLSLERCRREAQAEGTWHAMAAVGVESG